MNFGFSEEQELLRSEVAKFLAESCPMDEVRRIGEGPGFSPELWGQVSELGWPGLIIDEAHGGAGLGFVDLVVVLEEVGRALFPSPLISTTLAAHAIARAGSPEQQARLLPGLAAGTTIGSVAIAEAGDLHGAAGITLAAERNGDDWVLTGEKPVVADAAQADLFVVAFRTGEAEDAIAFGLVEKTASGVSVEDRVGIDLTKRQGRLGLEGVRLGKGDVFGDSELLSQLLDAGATAVVAESVGAAEAALALTSGYAKERIQFGRPIGQFQAVKHPLAVMYRDIESFKSLVYYAAWCIDEGHADRSVAASRAKAMMSDTFPQIGIDTVQLHGGMGYTWEYDAHLFLKRAKWARPVFGDADHHYERVAALGGL
ncbi:MAG: acyl-CoA dehydrogenase family protein [Myxococcota bacterium]|nr:acyl-CoA dehydrogenase family protein [Myxococcota bacterium]